MSEKRGSVLLVAPLTPSPPLEFLESPTVRRLSNNFRGGEASKGRLWLVKVKLLKLCRTTRSYTSELLCALVV